MKQFWPSESETYWEEVNELTSSHSPSDTFKLDRVVEKVPLYAARMTSFDAVYLDDVIQYVNNCNPDMRNHVSNVLQEPTTGHTRESWDACVFTPNQYMKDVSVWTVKSFHHWLTFQQMSSRSISTYKRIVEVGAGIGESARILFDLKQFNGEYTILDLPPIIQYSKKNLSNIDTGNAKLSFATSLNEIDTADSDTLLFSTWGLSEIGMDYRLQVLERMRNADMFVAFQSIIFGVNNNNFFLKEYPTRYKKNIRVRNITNHTVDKGNFYVYGSNYTL